MEPGHIPGFGAQLITQTPSPNCGPRKDALQPDLLVLHYTAMADTGAVIRHLCNPSAQVSAHYVVSPLGEITQLVREEDRAWHAGAANWGGEADVNSRSIGVEIVNDGFQPFSAPQMDKLETLIAEICARWDIHPKGVIGHSCVAPGRKIDPGARFDWARLARRGLCVAADGFAGGARVDAGVFRADLQRYGMTSDVSDDTLLAAFRLRHRPGVWGALDLMDMALASDLAARFAVDPARRMT